jgi:DNA-binding response OmpR family regulator
MERGAVMNEPTPPSDLAEPKSKTVLLVDDDESILDLLEHVVRKEGFVVERAQDGEEAVRKIAALTPSVVILDFMLPGMGGFEVLKDMQSNEARNIPVLVVTGRRIDPQTVDMLKQEPNVKDFIEKPIRTASLISQLHRILGTQPAQTDRRVDRGPMSSGW